MEWLIAAGVVGGVFFMVVVLSGLFTVEQQTRAIVERFGKLHKTAGPGLNFKIPLIDRVAGHSKATIMMIPYTPDGMSQVGDQITQALLATHESGSANGTAPTRRPPQAVRSDA